MKNALGAINPNDKPQSDLSGEFFRISDLEAHAKKTSDELTVIRWLLIVLIVVTLFKK